MTRAMVLTLAVAGLGLSACEDEPPPVQVHQRTLAEARDMALEVFQELDGFELERQREVGLAGRPAVRMEAVWSFNGESRRGIILIVDHPSMFNIIHYTAPDESGMYEAGLSIFQDMVRDLRVIHHEGKIEVKPRGDKRVMRSPDLQLEITYPVDWVYTLDEVNRAMVFSGPKQSETWLTTVSFSVIDKWEKAP